MTTQAQQPDPFDPRTPQRDRLLVTVLATAGMAVRDLNAANERLPAGAIRNAVSRLASTLAFFAGFLRLARGLPMHDDPTFLLVLEYAALGCLDRMMRKPRPPGPRRLAGRGLAWTFAALKCLATNATIGSPASVALDCITASAVAMGRLDVPHVEIKQLARVLDEATTPKRLAYLGTVRESHAERPNDRP
jgi:hypothetical protein